LKEHYEAKEKILSSETMRYHERMVMLSVIDGLWKDHLLSMDHLKEGIGLRGYAQKDPLVEYKSESYDMFEAMMLKFQEDTVRFLFRMQILGPDGQPVDAAPRPSRAVPRRLRVASSARPLELEADEPLVPMEEAAMAMAARQGSTTIDSLEKEFHRKKQRELDAASRAALETAASPCSAGPAKKWAATIPAPAARARSTKSAVGGEVERFRPVLIFFGRDGFRDGFAEDQNPCENREKPLFFFGLGGRPQAVRAIRWIILEMGESSSAPGVAVFWARRALA